MRAARSWAWLAQVLLSVVGVILLQAASSAGWAGPGAADAWVVLALAAAGALLAVLARWVRPRRFWAPAAIGAFALAAAWSMLTAVGAGSAPPTSEPAGWAAVLVLVVAVVGGVIAFPPIDFARRAQRANRRFHLGLAVIDVVADLQWLVRRAERDLGPEHPDTLGTRLHLAAVLLEADRFDVAERILTATAVPVRVSGDADLVEGHAQLAAFLRD